MFGTIIGDVIGSYYEFYTCKSLNFPLFRKETRFTDDTVLTIAIADAFMNKKDYATTLKEYAKKYPLAGFGGGFVEWVDRDDILPYNSWGNGSAMRVSSIAWLCNTIEEVLLESKKTAEVTHNHPEGIKGAQAIASAIFLARTNKSKTEIKEFISTKFDYNLDRTLDKIRPTYEFDVSCKGSVPEAIIAFLESENFEDCIRKSISIGGDSDTIAAMAGGIAEAYYKNIPEEIYSNVCDIIFKEVEFYSILCQFYETIKDIE